ncbi:electron transfer flavoprotein beta subunit [Phakopsora pachyrhizi]|uniref:Probable electron transfer flavoprotein subunit beta n=1 Tax=Phakopsora pachyrhizi TaxID=170000 RepID=A0AAV0ACM1_PHAPC|nr:electron transfer flavoprotein beta subunit [Phakopsora pachyrhizi]CAH7665726.1 electron transfer flavo protein beta subunit [Phakopsora pachyrhizi]
MRCSLIHQIRVLVPIKRTIDYAVKIRVKPNQTAVETDGVKHSMNPFDEIAVEEAIRLRERYKEKIESITLLTITKNKKGGQEVLRTGLAMGADDGILIQWPESSKSDPDPSSVSKTISNLISKRSEEDEKKRVDLIICGKQAIDDDCSQVGGMLSGRLNWSLAQFISKIEFDSEFKRMDVEREIDGGIEKLLVPLPAVLTTDLRLNEPRYASLPNIMKAKKKPIETIKVEDLGIDPNQLRLEILKVEEPEKRKGGTKVEDVSAVVEKLKELGSL